MNDTIDGGAQAQQVVEAKVVREFKDVPVLEVSFRFVMLFVKIGVKTERTKKHIG